jgi:uncharacterized protein YggL (DUF469 family)
MRIVIRYQNFKNLRKKFRMVDFQGVAMGVSLEYDEVTVTEV